MNNYKPLTLCFANKQDRENAEIYLNNIRKTQDGNFNRIDHFLRIDNEKHSLFYLTTFIEEK